MPANSTDSRMHMMTIDSTYECAVYRKCVSACGLWQQLPMPHAHREWCLCHMQGWTNNNTSRSQGLNKTCAHMDMHMDTRALTRTYTYVQTHTHTHTHTHTRIDSTPGLHLAHGVGTHTRTHTYMHAHTHLISLVS